MSRLTLCIIISIGLHGILFAVKNPIEFKAPALQAAPGKISVQLSYKALEAKEESKNIEIEPAKDLPTLPAKQPDSTPRTARKIEVKNPPSATLTKANKKEEQKNFKQSTLSEPPIRLASAIEYRSNPAPNYPDQARRRGQQGNVTFLISITKEGQAGDIKITKSSGHRLLDYEALKAVKKWRFKPATINGINVSGNVIVTIEFKLQG
jgi:protein TonB